MTLSDEHSSHSFPLTKMTTSKGQAKSTEKLISLLSISISAGCILQELIEKIKESTLKMQLDLENTGKSKSQCLDHLSLLRNKRFREKEPFKIPLGNRYNCCPNSDLAKIVQSSNDSTNSHVKNLSDKRRNNNLIEINPDMDYFEAVGMIHNHIMSLNI